ncbi:NAD(P)H-binding protein [Streptomyces sp. WM6372]|uniref:NmrA family NAD(P)-binding protein n=1 Tax=Streptomyces sp. WM6372 TaxID=1415555 RepID=UPI00099D8297|nr:NAD(P)H-binding protein [Streptomyces sp. WM6372]
MTATANAATLVIGATGTTGSRTVAQLVADGRRVKAAGRAATPLPGAEPVRFDWYDPATYGDALGGADRVYLVPPIGDPDPAAVMLPFLERARAAGVRRGVLLSSSAIPAGGPAVGMVHQALPGLFDEWAVLRPSWFMQNFTGTHAHADGIRADGAILTAAGTGRVGFVDAEDIAAVAVRALTDDRAPDADLVLTGPEALSHDEVAAILTEVTGRPVVHRQLTYDAMRERLAAVIPAEFAAMLAGMDRAIAEGAEDRTTDTVERLTGRPPRGFREVAERELPVRELPVRELPVGKPAAGAAPDTSSR